ncbi:hypothetical protein G7Z17_g10109 [Cylindrodendrum hubeiense]|uniref:Uncharacterized protein n=1 Tax=Cylindrodendrum hubeiense TaxID=595255 RepID=A0A9P5H7T8_9HYPO|nr:hypothetical protein G7Z17_g10109 [Cylindrodendrum hubeiense]
MAAAGWTGLVDEARAAFANASPLDKETLAEQRALATMRPWHLGARGWNFAGTAGAHCCAQPFASDPCYAASGLIATRVARTRHGSVAD